MTDEEKVLEMFKTTKAPDKRGWTWTTIDTATKKLDFDFEEPPCLAVASLIKQGLLWESGARQFGTVRRIRLPEDAE